MKNIWVITVWIAEDNTTKVLTAFGKYCDGLDYAESVAENYSCKKVDEHCWDNPEATVRSTHAKININ